MYPYLPLSEIDLDPELARRLPRHLAYYHLALPVAEDENEITVALAQPDNRAARQVIESALDTTIVPVRSSDADIRAVLDRIWAGADTAHGGVLAWAEDAAAREALSTYIERTISTAYPELPVQISTATDADTLVEAARASHASLIVAHTTDAATRRALLLNAPAAIWLTRDITSPPHQLLAVLRLNTPDRQLLDWLPPLSRITDAETVVLAAAEQAATASGSPLFSRISSLLNTNDPRGAHIAELRHVFGDLGVNGRLRIREGTLGTALLDEAEHSPYDLLLMAAEASGGFAAETFERIWHRIGGALLIKAG